MKSVKRGKVRKKLTAIFGGWGGDNHKCSCQVIFCSATCLSLYLYYLYQLFLSSLSFHHFERRL